MILGKSEHYMKKIISVTLIFMVLLFASSCNKGKSKNDYVSQNLNESSQTNQENIYLIDYSLTLDEYIQRYKTYVGDVKSYQNDGNAAKIGNTIIETGTNGKICRIEIPARDADYSPITLWLNKIPGAITDGQTINSKLNECEKEEYKDSGNGFMITTKTAEFSENSIKYYRYITEGDSLSTGYISVECENCVINPLDYPSFVPNFTGERLYTLADTFFENENYEIAVNYYLESQKDDYEIKASDSAYKAAEKYIKEENWILAGEYAKLADEYGDSEQLLKTINENAYPLALSYLEEYADNGNEELAQKAHELFTACESNYEQVEKYKDISMTSRDRIFNYASDNIAKKIIMKHKLIEFIDYAGPFREMSIDHRIGEVLSSYFFISKEYDQIQFIVYDRIDNEYFTTNYPSDQYDIPEKLSQYDLNEGVLSYNDKQIFKISVIDESSITIYSTATEKTYNLTTEKQQ